MAEQGGYRNFQLLTSGIINPGTQTIIDTNYDPSYTLFKLQLVSLSPFPSGHLIMNFDNDFTPGHYNNLTSTSNTYAALSDDTGATIVADEFNGEYTIWWPNIPTPPNSAVFISGYSTYLDLLTGKLFRYQVFCSGLPASAGGAGHPSPFLAISGVVIGVGTVLFNNGYYVMSGSNGQGAALLSTSTQGG